MDSVSLSLFCIDERTARERMKKVKEIEETESYMARWMDGNKKEWSKYGWWED